MKLLAIDTSNTVSSIALLDGNTLAYQYHDTMPSKQAEHLFPLIESAFRTTGYNYQALDAIAVTVGPGSFTGIRIGLAAARGIALATKLPVIGVTALEAAAWVAQQDASYKAGTPVLAALDARRNEVYAQVFLSPLQPISGAVLIAYGEVLPLLPAKEIFLTGSGADLVAPILQQHSVPHTKGADTSPCDAVGVAHVAALKFPGQNPNIVPSPFYIRKPDAKPQASQSILKHN